MLADGCLLGLVTGNTEAAADIKLHRAQLNRFFSFGGYGSDAADRNELTRIALERAALTFGAEVSADEASHLRLSSSRHADGDIRSR